MWTVRPLWASPILQIWVNRKISFCGSLIKLTTYIFVIRLKRRKKKKTWKSNSQLEEWETMKTRKSCVSWKTNWNVLLGSRWLRTLFSFRCNKKMFKNNSVFFSSLNIVLVTSREGIRQSVTERYVIMPSFFLKKFIWFEFF